VRSTALSFREIHMLRLTRDQVREIDRRSIQDYHIPGIVLMENAARAVTDTAMEFLTPGKKALILCGGGNNGGDGLAVARHLQNRGVDVHIGLTIPPEKYRGDALINWNILRAMALPFSSITPDAISQSPADLIIDAIFGTGLQQAPRPPFAQIVAALRDLARPILAVDLPSGMDCDTGNALGDCITAIVTVTFVAEKAGFASPSAKQFTGRIVVGDIGCPIELLAAQTPAG
jgi:NAD(P)H-hydrate epimerase